jgi:Domain of unknown function (DUF1707)
MQRRVKIHLDSFFEEAAMEPTTHADLRASPQQAAGASRPPVIRAAESDRDATAQRLQEAFAERRIDADELDQRLHSALTARTTAELDALTADLPAVTARQFVPARRSPAHAPGRFAVAIKGVITRAGHWRVPHRLDCLVYKGSGVLDLSSAELTSAVTTIRAVAYKSRIRIMLPPGMRLEVSGIGVSHDYLPGATATDPAGSGASVLHVKGLAYKGGIDVQHGAAAPPPEA